MGRGDKETGAEKAHVEEKGTPREPIREVVEVEEFGKKNEKPPPAMKYVIRIDSTKYTVDVSHMTGRQLLELAHKAPPERYSLYQKMHGGAKLPVGLDQDVDFTTPGLEKFVTLPLDQTEG